MDFPVVTNQGLRAQIRTLFSSCCRHVVAIPGPSDYLGCWLGQQSKQFRLLVTIAAGNESIQCVQLATIGLLSELIPKLGDIIGRDGQFNSVVQL